MKKLLVTGGTVFVSKAVADVKVGPSKETSIDGEALEHSAIKVDIDLILYVKLRDFLQISKTCKEIQELCGY